MSTPSALHLAFSPSLSSRCKWFHPMTVPRFRTQTIALWITFPDTFPSRTPVPKILYFSHNSHSYISEIPAEFSMLTNRQRYISVNREHYSFPTNIVHVFSFLLKGATKKVVSGWIIIKTLYLAIYTYSSGYLSVLAT